MKGGDNINQPKHIGDVPVEGLSLRSLKAMNEEAFKKGIRLGVDSVIAILARNRVAHSLPLQILRNLIDAEVQGRITKMSTSTEIKRPR